jgi:hypothetical protein
MLGILVTLMGESIAFRLVCDAWPEISSDSTNSLEMWFTNSYEAQRGGNA